MNHLYNSKKIVSELSKQAMNKRLKAQGYTEKRNSKVSRWITSYWKPGNMSDRIMVIFRGNCQKSCTKAF